MKIQYDSEADVLPVIVRDEPPADAIEESGGVIVSYGEDKEPVSIDPEKKNFGVKFLNASARRLVRPGEMTVTMEAKAGVRS